MDGNIAYILKLAIDGAFHHDPSYKQLCLEIIIEYIKNEIGIQNDVRPITRF